MFERARNLGYVVFVEGESDCWALWLHDIPAVGIPGATMTKLVHPDYVDGIGTVYILREPDDAGARFVADTASRLRGLGYSGGVQVLDLKEMYNVKDASDLHIALSKTSRSPAELKDSFKDQLERAIDKSHRLDSAETLRFAFSSNITKPRPRLIMHNLSQIEAASVQSLWTNRVFVGEPCVIAGIPGVGKGFVAGSIASALSRGAAPPGGGDLREPCDVIVLALEDDPSRVLRPRYESLGADLERIHIIDGIRVGEGRVTPFSLEHIELLEQTFDELLNVRLIIIDPIASMLAGIDTWRSNEVRERFDPFLDRTSERNVTVIMNTLCI